MTLTVVLQYNCNNKRFIKGVFMTKSIKLANIVLMFMIALGDVTYILTGHILAKSVTSVLFVVLGAVNLIYAFKETTKNRKFIILMLIGLFFACLGDVVLYFQFCVGAGLFAVGHILFFASYIFLEKFDWKDLIPSGVIFVASLLIILLAPVLKMDILMTVVAIVYALVISTMLGKAISNLIKNKNALNIVILIGSALFYFSDLMLLFARFGGIYACSVLCLATYYPAEVLLAFSILLARDKQQKNQKLNKLLNNIKQSNPNKPKQS